MSHDLALYLLAPGLLAWGLWRVRRSEIGGRRSVRSTPIRPPTSDLRPPDLTEGEMRAALSVGEEHLLWRAVMQSIEVMRDRAIEEMEDIDTQARPATLHYHCGGSAYLVDLRNFLRAEREKALKGGGGGNDQ